MVRALGNARRRAGRRDRGGRLSGDREADLRGRLEEVLRKAARGDWPGWTDRDRDAIEAALSEIDAFSEALSAGIDEAFRIGIEYGKKEEELDELNRDIAELTARLARQAWGGGAGRA